MKHIALLCMLLATLAGCRPSEDDIRRIVREEMNAAMQRTIVRPVNVIGPYSPAVKIGRFLFVSGQIGLDQQTKLLRNDNIEVETQQVLENLRVVLNSEGFDSTNVVTATVYLKNMNDYDKMNQVYGGYFQEGNYPSRVTVQVGDLPKQANVEIAVIAYK
jgi:2-iminobutanoate/2-iminopropanoate deaminase